MYILEHSQSDFFENPLNGIVEKAIIENGIGRVKVMGVSWMARLSTSEINCDLSPGTPVRVLGRSGNTLWVLPYQHKSTSKDSTQ